MATQSRSCYFIWPSGGRGLVCSSKCLCQNDINNVTYIPKYFPQEEIYFCWKFTTPESISLRTGDISDPFFCQNNILKRKGNTIFKTDLGRVTIHPQLVIWDIQDTAPSTSSSPLLPTPLPQVSGVLLGVVEVEQHAATGSLPRHLPGILHCFSSPLDCPPHLRHSF